MLAKHQIVRTYKQHACKLITLQTMRQKRSTEMSSIFTLPIEMLRGSENHNSILPQGPKKKITGRRSIVDMAQYQSTPFVPHVSALEGLFAQAKINSALGGRVRAIMETNPAASTVSYPAFTSIRAMRPSSSADSVSSAASSVQYSASTVPNPASTVPNPASIVSYPSTASSSTISVSPTVSSSSTASGVSTASLSLFPRNVIRFHTQDPALDFSTTVDEKDFSLTDVSLSIQNNYTWDELITLVKFIFGGAHTIVKTYPELTTTPKLSKTKIVLQPNERFIFVTILTANDDVKNHEIQQAMTNLKNETDSFDTFVSNMSEDLESSPLPSKITQPPLTTTPSAKTANTITYTKKGGTTHSFTYSQVPKTAADLRKLFKTNLTSSKNFIIKQNEKCFRDNMKDDETVTSPPINLTQQFEIEEVPLLEEWLQNNSLKISYASAQGTYLGKRQSNMCMYNALSIAWNAFAAGKTGYKDVSGDNFKQTAIQELKENKTAMMISLPVTDQDDIKITDENEKQLLELFWGKYPLFTGMLEYNKSANEYIRYIEKSGTMGGEEELRCISKALGESFVIIVNQTKAYTDCSEKDITDESRWQRYYLNGQNVDTIPTDDTFHLNLLYGLSHYNALIPIT